jgi:hypothetical protein
MPSSVPGIRRLGDPATRRPGDPATRRPGDPATRRPGDPATRRPGDPATRRHGDPANSTPSEPRHDEKYLTFGLRGSTHVRPPTWSTSTRPSSSHDGRRSVLFSCVDGHGLDLHWLEAIEVLAIALAVGPGVGFADSSSTRVRTPIRSSRLTRRIRAPCSEAE